VKGVDEGLSAQAGGLRAGDIILAMNGRIIEELDRSARIAALRASPLRLRVLRGEGELDLDMTLD